MVKFYSTGDYDHINGHDYVIIGGLKWATMNVGATTVAESNATAFGGFYAWGEVDTYYNSYTDSSVSWYKNSTLTHKPGSKFSHNWSNYGTGEPQKNFQEWSPVPYDSKYQLTANYDVARAKWGGTWRIPTMADVNARIAAEAAGDGLDYVYICQNNTIFGTMYHELKPLPEDGIITKGGIYWEPQNSTVDGFPYNVAGVLFIMMDDTNQRVFFPAAGNIQNVQRYSVGTLCTYWSANAYDKDLPNAYTFYISKTTGITYNQKLSFCNVFSIFFVFD